MIESSKHPKNKTQNNPKKTKQNISKVIEDIETIKKTEESEKALRPKTIEEYVGQEGLKKQLNLILSSANIRQVMPEHLLFYGPAGLGKTTIANLIANEINANFKVITASSLQRVGDIVALLSNLEDRTVLFIDEIHRLKAPLEESLYSAMEDQTIDILIGKGTGATTLRIDLPNITIVGATTLVGRLSKPLRDRFASTFQLELYSIPELIKIINNSSTKLGVNIAEELTTNIASKGRGTPRIVNNITKRLLDYKIVNKVEEFDMQTLEVFLSDLGLYEYGLMKSDIKYLRSLERSQLSLKTLAGVLMEEIETIEQVIEPYLLYLGFIAKDSNGRKITHRGVSFLESIAH